MTGGTTAVSIGLAVASAAMAAVSSVQQAQQQSAQAKYQGAVAKNNQIIANQNAAAALKQGDNAAAESREKTQAMIGQQRASLAAQGGDINSGTALDIQSDTAGAGALDALTIKNNAAQQARQYQIQGNNFQADAQLQSMAGKNATAGGYTGVGTSLLGGASRGAGIWSDYTKLGPNTNNPAGTLSGGGPRGF
jgi:hypothetical protein